MNKLSPFDDIQSRLADDAMTDDQASAFFDSLTARHLSYSMKLGLQTPTIVVEMIWLRQ
jgi:hypothetical protein